MAYRAACDILLYRCANASFDKRKADNMAVSYNGLWKMLIDKNMYKKDLSADLGISSATMAKMGRGENVSMDILEKICDYMDCNIGDIMSFEKDRNEKED